MRDPAAEWLWAASAGVRGKAACLSVCQVAYGLCAIAYALLLREIVDAAVAGDAAGFASWIVVTAFLVLAQLGIRAAIRGLNELVKASLENALKLRLFDVIMRGDFGRVSAVHSGEWMNRLTNDAKVAADGMAEIIPGAVGTFARLVGSLVAILWLDPRLTVVLLPGGAALIVLSFLFRKKLKALHRSIQEADGRLRAFLQDRLAGLISIHSFAAEVVSHDGAADLAKAHLNARMRRNRFSNVCNFGFGLVMSGATLGAIAWCGYGILTGTMSFGTLTAMAQLVGQVQSPLANISGYLPRWYAMLGSAERLSEAEGLAGTVGKAHSLAYAKEFYDRDFAAVGLEDVSYAYWPATDAVSNTPKEGMPLAVEGLSLEVKKGEYVALAGDSGCGKSTTLRIMMGAYEQDGGIRYILVQNGSRIPLDSSLRRLFAYVPQGNQLMGGTIREVISLGSPDEAYDEDRLREALAVACADEFVSELDEGVDALLGERGAGLSEGQMQRLAVARAVFSGSPILLLDEATSALDASTEARLLHNLRTLEDRTVIVAAHRQAALEACDRVVRFTKAEAHE